MHFSYTRENILPKSSVSWAVLACSALFLRYLWSLLIVAKTDDNVVWSTTFLVVKKSRNRLRDPKYD